MDSDQRLIDAAMQNFIGSGRKLVAHIDGADDRFCGRVYAFRTGIPISIFNGVIVDWSPVTSDVEGALDWVDEWDVPYLLYLPEPLVDDLAPVTTRRELRLGAWQVPHMALAPVDPPPPPPGVTLRPVATPESMETFRQVMAETGVPKPEAARLFSDSFLDDDEVVGFVAELDGRPAGTSIAIRTGEVAGVYAVGTIEAARRRGVGTAATWAAVGAARTWGSSVVVLQSSAMGFGVYEAMGFRTVARFAGFTGRRAGTG